MFYRVPPSWLHSLSACSLASLVHLDSFVLFCTSLSLGRAVVWQISAAVSQPDVCHDISRIIFMTEVICQMIFTYPKTYNLTSLEFQFCSDCDIYFGVRDGLSCCAYTLFLTESKGLAEVHCPPRDTTRRTLGHPYRSMHRTRKLAKLSISPAAMYFHY